MTPPAEPPPRLSWFAIRRAVWGLRVLRLRYLVRRMCRRIWWIDRYCDVFGHQWAPSDRVSGKFYCGRCHRKRLMLWNRNTGETTWIITP